MFWCKNELFTSLDGFAQGSPISPGAATFYAADVERVAEDEQVIHNNRNRNRDGRGNRGRTQTKYSVRWMDDLTHCVDLGRSGAQDGWGRFLSETFYSEQCVLESELPDVFAGIKLNRTQTGEVLCRANLPNWVSLVQSGRLEMLRLAHAKGLEGGNKQIARAVSLVTRVVDLCSGKTNINDLHTMIMGQPDELKRVGFSTRTLSRALRRLEFKHQYLQISLVRNSLELPEPEKAWRERGEALLREELIGQGRMLADMRAWACSQTNGPDE